MIIKHKHDYKTQTYVCKTESIVAFLGILWLEHKLKGTVQ
jgi:hypothetical protein